MIKARFSSTCPSCGMDIKKGKPIVKDKQGKWIHSHCAVEEHDSDILSTEPEWMKRHRILSEQLLRP